MVKLVLGIVCFGALFFVGGVQRSDAQVVTTYYAPAYTVGVVPVRRGIFGLRKGYAPVVTGTVAVPVSTYYPTEPVTTYYAPAPVTTYYAPAPVTTYYPPVPVTTYYAPASVRTYYPPAVIIGR